jgi:transitional endoplasmic reticulum ATPase
MFTLPNVDNPIETRRTMTDNGPALVVTGSVKKAERDIVLRLCETARAILREASIYRGKAIRIKTDEQGRLRTDTAPEFIDVRKVKPEELILNPDETAQVEASLWSPVRNTDHCLRHHIPLNRGVLLEGTYGTGKTMTAHTTAKICEDNGWTFIMLDDVRGLKHGLMLAQRYQPAVIFAEDIDRVISTRDQTGNDILNTIDGVVTKNSKVITVLTTNHVEKLDKAMLRPGRLDAIVTVRPPEDEAVQRLIRLYARDTLDPDADLSEVSEHLAGNIPATIREVVERSKLTMISRGEDTLSGESLRITALGMTRHLELMKDDAPEPSAAERLAQSLSEVVSGHLGNSQTELATMLSNTIEELQATRDSVEQDVASLSERVVSGTRKVGTKLEEVAEDTSDIRKKVS